jgi:hypothetical protein
MNMESLEYNKLSQKIALLYDTFIKFRSTFNKRYLCPSESESNQIWILL